MSAKVTTTVNYEGTIELPGGLKMYVGTGNYATTVATATVNIPFNTVVAAAAQPITAAAVTWAVDGPAIRDVASDTASVEQMSDGSLRTRSNAKMRVIREDASGGVSGAAFSILAFGR